MIIPGKVKRRGAERRWGRFGDKNHLWLHIDDHRWESICKQLMFHRADDAPPQEDDTQTLCEQCVRCSER